MDSDSDSDFDSKSKGVEKCKFVSAYDIEDENTWDPVIQTVSNQQMYFLSKVSDAYLETLTSQQQRVVGLYKAGHLDYMGQYVWNPASWKNRYATEDHEQRLEQLKEIMNGAPKTPFPMTVYRGTYVGLYDRKVGEMYRSRNFVSTTMKPYGGAQRFVGTTIYEIHLPIGVPVLCLDTTVEFEILLNMNTTFRIISRRTCRYKKYNTVNFISMNAVGKYGPPSNVELKRYRREYADFLYEMRNRDRQMMTDVTRRINEDDKADEPKQRIVTSSRRNRATVQSTKRAIQRIERARSNFRKLIV